MHRTSHLFPYQDVLGCFQCQSVSTWSKMLLKKSTIRALIKGQVSQKISSDSSFCANWRSLPLARAGPVVPRPSDQVATGHLQVPLVPGEDPHTVISGAEAQRVQLLQLKRHKTGRRGSKAAIKIKKNPLTPRGFMENKTDKMTDKQNLKLEKCRLFAFWALKLSKQLFPISLQMQNTWRYICMSCSATFFGVYCTLLQNHTQLKYAPCNIYR